MPVTGTRNPVVLEPASQAFVEATPRPPFLYELSPAEARAVLDELQAAPIDKPPVDDRWITVPADVGDVRVRIVRPAGRRRGAAGDPLHARRRLGARQRRHARPTRPRARRRHRRRGRLRRVRPLARGPLPRRHRAGVRDRPVDRARGRRQPARPQPHRRRRRLGRRQHDRRAHAHGARSAATCASCTSRCTTRSPTPRWTPAPTSSSPRATSCTAKVMAWFWDAYAPDVERRGEPLRLAAARQRRAARGAPAGAS